MHRVSGSGPVSSLQHDASVEFKSIELTSRLSRVSDGARLDIIYKDRIARRGDATFPCASVRCVLHPDLPLIENQRAGMAAVNDFE